MTIGNLCCGEGGGGIDDAVQQKQMSSDDPGKCFLEYRRANRRLQRKTCHIDE
jgi:hypothetical protein